MFSLAEQNNSSVQEYAAGEVAAAEDLRVSRNDQLPDINASLQFSYIGNGWLADRNFKNGQTFKMPHFGNDLLVSVSEVIYGGGAVSKNVEMADLRSQIAQLRSKDNMQDVRFLLIGYYLGIYQLDNAATVYRENIRQTEMLVDEITASYEQGIALRSDITRYRLQLEDLKLGLTEVLNDREIMNRQLCTGIGIDPETVIQVDTTTLDGDFLYEKEDYWMGMVENTPALQLADRSVDLSNTALRLVRSDMYPKIIFTANDYFDGPILIEVPPINSNFNYYQIGVGISYNFATLFKSTKNVRKAKAEAAMAAARRQTVYDASANAVHSGYVKLKEAYDRRDTKEINVQLATENYDEVHYRYINGLALITDMLDGSNVKLQAELDLVNARIGILYQYFLLRKTSGIL
ncbi:MAG: TolC family protein [Bacteroidales bacterium]|nr:TolC family protein [Bacteroidales bacterium]